MPDWFTVNVRDTPWMTHETFGSACRFEDREAPFPQLAINLRVLQPGQPNCLYHQESPQEPAGDRQEGRRARAPRVEPSEPPRAPHDAITHTKAKAT